MAATRKGGQMAQQTSATRHNASGAATAFLAVVIIIAAAVVAEFFLAGWGTFDGVHSGATAGDTSAFDPHKTLGYAIAALGVVSAVLAVPARLGGRVLGMTVALFVLAGPVQALLAHAGEDSGAGWGAVHGLVGALILGLVATLLRIGSAGRRPR
ncbi:MAG TPA: DUF6220 domain-containing protein [Streptosporangiaceae bacterium]